VGGTGFLGYHFAKLCIKKKYTVISLSRKKPKKIRFLKRMKYIFTDITKKKQLFNKLGEYDGIKYVVNFGGEVEHNKIKQTFLSHYKGLKNISEFFINKKIKKFVQIGTSLEYGNSKSPQKEINRVKPNSNYSRAKALSSTYILKLFNKKKFPASLVRPYQVYGPKQDYNRFIPILITSCLKNKKFPCSEGSQYRDFLFIDDFIQLILKIIESKNKITDGKIFNAGYGKPIRIKDIINKVLIKIRRGRPIFGKVPLRKDENMITYPDISNCINLLKWRPQTNFDNGLNKTINYYKKNK